MSDEHLTTIELEKEEMKFSAGHFTIFSSTERERLHGHNFRVHAALTGAVDENGLFADYGLFKRLLRAKCAELDEHFLLPGRSPHLAIERAGALIHARFGEEVIPFPAGDVLVLPVRNTTVEELARYLAEELVRSEELVGRYDVRALTVKVSSGPGQWGSYAWRREP